MIHFKKPLKRIKYLFRTDFIYIATASLLVILMRLMSPLIQVRIGKILRPQRIGHLGMEPDLYLSKKLWENNKESKKIYIDLFYYFTNNPQESPQICNSYLKKLVERHIPSLRFSKIIHYIDYINQRFKNSESYSFDSFEQKFILDKNLFTCRMPPNLILKNKEIIEGYKKCETLGINLNKPLVLFFNRDATFLSKFFNIKNDNANDFRNASIVSFLPMAETFGELGYTCVRGGAEASEPLVTNNKNIIDYVNLCRTPFLDVFLASKCKFTVSDITGLIALPTIFRKPRVYVNTISLLTFYRQDFFDPQFFNSLLIFKKHWCLKENRLLNVSEISAKGLSQAFDTNNYKKNQIKLIDNTPEEIQEVALEMHRRLNGEWVETEEDILFEHRFWSKLGVKRDLRFLSSYPRVGTNFLRNNEWLLK